MGRTASELWYFGVAWCTSRCGTSLLWYNGTFAFAASLCLCKKPCKKPKSGSGQKWARGRPPPHAVFINPQPYPRPQVGRGGPGGCRTPLFGLVAPSRTLVVGFGGTIGCSFGIFGPN